jgi:hypothetical protein
MNGSDGGEAARDNDGDVSIRDRLELEGAGVSKRVGANVAPERRMRRWKGPTGDGTGHPTEALKQASCTGSNYCRVLVMGIGKVGSVPVGDLSCRRVMEVESPRRKMKRDWRVKY